MYSAEAGQPSVRAAPRRPRLGPADYGLLLWRAKWLILLVFLPLLALGLLAALALPERHTAEARLIALPPATQAMGPGGGETAGGVLVRSDIDLLRSAPVVQAALDNFGGARLYPAIAARCSGAECHPLYAAEALRGLRVSAAPGSQVIRVTFRHREPAMAEGFLGALASAYVTYRASLLGDAPASGLELSYERLQAELDAAEAALRAHSGAAAASARDQDDKLRQLIIGVNRELLINAARLSEAQALLAAHRRQIRDVPPELDLYVDDTSGQRLQEMQLEREELRARLSPDSPILRDLDRRIERAELFLDRRPAPEGARRRGANPLYQELEAAILKLEAEVEAIGRQEAALRGQLATLDTQRAEIAGQTDGLAPLLRRRDVAQGALDALMRHDAEMRLQAELAGSGAGRLRLVEPPAVTGRADTVRLVSAVLAGLVALLVALLAGLANVVSRRGFATAGAVERTLNLPVLATVPGR